MDIFDQCWWNNHISQVLVTHAEWKADDERLASVKENIYMFFFYFIMHVKIQINYK